MAGNVRFVITLFLCLCLLSLFGCRSDESKKITRENMNRVTQKLNIPSTKDALGVYLEENLAIGNKKEAALDALRPIEPKRLTQLDVVPGNLLDLASECYVVEFYDLVRHRLFDRHLCFDHENQIIEVLYLIGLE